MRQSVPDFRRKRSCRSNSKLSFAFGASSPPLLANVYLHYVFDLWAEVWREKVATGDMIVVRYADDLVAGFQHRADAERFLKEFQERLAKFELEVHPDKTRLIAFGREAWRNRKRPGQAKLETFTFLGFHALLRRELERLLSGVAGNGREADEGQAPADQAGVARSDARAGSSDRAVAQAGGVGLLPISRRTGKSTATGAFPLATDSIMAEYITPPESEVTGDLEGDRPHL
jgi:hypothetical protein